MLVFLVLLALIMPFVVVQPLEDEIALAKLATTAALTGGAFVWGAVLLLRDRWPAGRWPVTLCAPVVFFVLVNILALIFAEEWRASLMGEYQRYQGLAATILYVLLFGATAVAVRTRRDLRWLLLGLYAGALGTAVYALLQKAGWAWWPTPLPDRPGSTVGQANELGAFLVVAMSASLFLVLTERVPWRRWALTAGLVVMAAALLVTLSRSAYLAAGAATLVWGGAAVAWYLPRLRVPRHGLALRLGVAAAAAVPLVIALVLVFFIGLPQGRVAILSETNDQATDKRLTLWRLGLEMTLDRPLLGYGQDGFSIKFPEYRDRPDLPGIGTTGVDPESAHNAFVDFASGTGILGLAAFLALVAAVLWHAARRALTTGDDELRIALVALSAAAIGYLVAIFFGFTESMTTWALWLVLGATAGLLARVPAPPEDEDDPSPESGTLASAVTAVVLLVVGLVALGWAATMIAADLAAAQARDAANRGDHEESISLAGRAVTLNPLYKEYLALKAANYERAAATLGTEEAYALAIETYRTLERRHPPDSFYTLKLALAEAQLAQTLGLPVQLAFPDLERAVELDPYYRTQREFVARFYEQQGFNGLGFRHRVIIRCWTVDCDLE